MRKTIVVVILGLALAMAGATLHAEEAAPAPPPPAMSPGSSQLSTGASPCVLLALRVVQPQMANALAARLSFTDEQKTKLADLLKNSEKSAEPLVEAVKVSSEKFGNALIKDATTKEQLSALGDEAMKAESALLKQRVETLFSLKALLTAEQKVEFAKIMTQLTRPWHSNAPR